MLASTSAMCFLGWWWRICCGESSNCCTICTIAGAAIINNILSRGDPWTRQTGSLDSMASLFLIYLFGRNLIEYPYCTWIQLFNFLVALFIIDSIFWFLIIDINIWCYLFHGVFKLYYLFDSRANAFSLFVVIFFYLFIDSVVCSQHIVVLIITII